MQHPACRRMGQQQRQGAASEPKQAEVPVVQSAAAGRLAARHAAAATRTPNEVNAQPEDVFAAELTAQPGQEEASVTEVESNWGSPAQSLPSYHDAEEYRDDDDGGVAEVLPPNDVPKELPRRNDVTKVHARLRSR